MDRLLMSNPSGRMDCITSSLNRNRTAIGADELRRRRHAEVFPITSTTGVVKPAKGILREKKPVNNVTSGLPKSLKGYGNGAPIVVAYRNNSINTAVVMNREYEGVQHNNFNLRVSLAKGLPTVRLYNNKRQEPDIYRHV